MLADQALLRLAEKAIVQLADTFGAVFDIDADAGLRIEQYGGIAFRVRDADVQVCIGQVRNAVGVIGDGCFTAEHGFQQCAHGQPFRLAGVGLATGQKRHVIVFARQQSQ